MGGARRLRPRLGCRDRRDRRGRARRRRRLVHGRTVRAGLRYRPSVTTDDVLLIDDPAPRIRRLTLNRPEKRNALDDALRGSLFDALRVADRDREISVIIVR